MNEKKKVTKSLVDAQVKGELKMKNERKDARIQKQVETKTKFYSRENCMAHCPKCGSHEHTPFSVDDFTDETGDGERGTLYIGFTCKKCGLYYQDIWECQYIVTEGQEEVEKTTRKKQPITKTKEVDISLIPNVNPLGE